MTPTPPPKALLPLSITTSIPSHRTSNPFETPEIQISRPSSPNSAIVLPSELDFISNSEHHRREVELENGGNSRNTSKSRGSLGGSRSRDPLFKKSFNNDSIWFKLQSYFPISRSNSHTIHAEELELEEQEPRGRSNYIGGNDLTLGTSIKTLEEVGSIGGITSNQTKKKRKFKMMSKNKAQLAISFALIALVGMNDSATGANLVSMQAHYDVSYDQISIVFLSNVAGYFISCISSSYLTHHLGLQNSLVLACVIFSLGCIALALAPPFAVFTFFLSLLGFGSGLFDSCLTTVISHEEDPAIMSFAYAGFGVGATLAPLIIGGFVDKGIDWNLYYWIPFTIVIGFTIAAYLIFANYKPPQDEPSHSLPSPTTTTTNSTSTNTINNIPLTQTQSNQTTLSTKISHGEMSRVAGGGGGKLPTVGIRERMTRALKMRAVWVGFLLIVVAFGTCDTLSAWIVSYMVSERSAPSAGSRYMLSGLWGGISLGRIALAFVARKLGEKTFNLLMLGLASCCLGVIWGVKSVVLDAGALVLVGFFLGPVTPKVLSMVSARVPPSLKSSVMSLTIGLGLIGSSVGPLAFGVVAGRGGLGSLPGVLIGSSGIAAVGWLLVPKKVRRED